MSLPPVEVLSNEPTVLLRGPALRAIAGLAEAGLSAVQRGDRVAPRPELVALVEELRRQARLSEELLDLAAAVAPSVLEGGGQLVGAAEAAALLGVGERQARRLLEGLGRSKVGGRWMVEREIVVDLAAERSA